MVNKLLLNLKVQSWNPTDILKEKQIYLVKKKKKFKFICKELFKFEGLLQIEVHPKFIL